MKTNIVVTTKTWDIENFEKLKKTESDFNWVLITNKEDLSVELLANLDPKFVFFTHWSWIIKKEIYEEFNCVVFHMTDLPFGRGGSPLQNLISRGIKNTKLSAIKVVGGLDAGPVYVKEAFDLDGKAEDIYRRASSIAFRLIPWIVKERPEPVQQEGQVVEFKRRTPDMSEVPSEGCSIENVYDWIRMLDAEGYPRAFIDYGDYRLTFKDSELNKETIKAGVIFTRRDKNE